MAMAPLTPLPGPLAGERVESTFRGEGRSLGYEEIGTGDELVVLLHGLLLDARSNRATARRLATGGRRVVSLDFLGHGRSDHPAHASEYRMDVYADQVVALLDHLRAPTAVLIGTSLGANVSLFVAAQDPERVQGLVVEMPVLEWAVPPAALAFVPLLLAAHYAAPLVRAAGAVARRVPSGVDLLDAALGPLVTEPEVTASVLHGILVGPVAPTIDERRAITAPALVIGHRADLIHPFSDAEKLAETLPRARLVTARTPFELRVRPNRLVGEMSRFIDEVWPHPAAEIGTRKVAGGRKRR
jgi:pimeloyl-ACP methyl ester carboxylesterase